MKYDLTRPCPECPFSLADTAVRLTRDRAHEIVQAILNQDASFPCHKTVDYDDDEDGNDGRTVATSQHCAGAMRFLEDRNRPNQMMRIAERLGFYDASKLEAFPVVSGPEDMVDRRHG